MHPTNQAEVNNYFVRTDKNDDGSVAFKNYKFDHDYLRIRISLFLLRGAHPFTVVEEHSFRNMMHRACPQLKNISRHTLKMDIMVMFDREKRICFKLFPIVQAKVVSLLAIGNLLHKL